MLDCGDRIKASQTQTMREAFTMFLGGDNDRSIATPESGPDEMAEFVQEIGIFGIELDNMVSSTVLVSSTAPWAWNWLAGEIVIHWSSSREVDLCWQPVSSFANTGKPVYRRRTSA